MGGTLNAVSYSYVDAYAYANANANGGGGYFSNTATFDKAATFTGNTAQGGTANITYTGGTLNAAADAAYADARADAYGGGGYFQNTATFQNAATFSGNTAQGGTATAKASPGFAALAFADGRGGGMYTRGDLTLQKGGLFMNNHAGVSSNSPYARGLGGAVFFDGVGGNQSHNLSAVSGSPLIFTGNTHMPNGLAGGKQLNSLYFGNTSIRETTAVATTRTATLTLATSDADAIISMRDPMASQEDNRQTSAPSYYLYNNVEVIVNKTGAGTWELGGHNAMKSATTIDIQGGTFRAVADTWGGSLHLDLSHPATSKFTMANGTTLDLATNTRIWGKDVTFGTVTASINPTGLFYSPEIMSIQSDTLTLGGLNLPATTLSAVSLGLYDYTNANFALNPATGGIGLASYASRSYNHARGATSAVSAPGAVMLLNPAGNVLQGRVAGNFKTGRPNFAANLAGLTDNGATPSPQALSFLGQRTLLNAAGVDGTGYASRMRGHEHFIDFSDSGTSAPIRNNRQGMNALMASADALNASGMSGKALGLSSLWVMPGYAHSRYSDNISYDISAYSVSLGADFWLNDSVFMGLAFTPGYADYNSSHADVEAESMTAALYGGAKLPYELELAAHVSATVSDFEQDRKVEGYTHSSDYDGTSITLGLSLARPFALTEKMRLRPSVGYEAIFTHTDAINEDPGPLALNVKSSDSTLHQLTAGTSLAYTFENKVELSGRLYYVGLYGDTQNKVNGEFTGFPGTLRLSGEKMDEHSGKVGVGLALPLADKLNMGLNYDLQAGQNTLGHQATVGLRWEF